MTVPSTTHNLNGFLKNVVSRTKGAKSALSTLIISRLWNFSIELKPPSFIFVLAHKGTFLSSLPTISIALNQVHLKVIKRQFSRMSMFYQGLQTVHIVFFSEVFFLNDPITKFSFEFFFLLPNTLWTAEPKTRQKTATCDRRKQAIVNTLGFFSFHADDVFNRIHNSDYQCLICLL